MLSSPEAPKNCAALTRFGGPVVLLLIWTVTDNINCVLTVNPSWPTFAAITANTVYSKHHSTASEVFNSALVTKVITAVDAVCCETPEQRPSTSRVPADWTPSNKYPGYSHPPDLGTSTYGIVWDRHEATQVESGQTRYDTTLTTSGPLDSNAQTVQAREVQDSGNHMSSESTNTTDAGLPIPLSVSVGNVVNRNYSDATENETQLSLSFSNVALSTAPGNASQVLAFRDCEIAAGEPSNVSGLVSSSQPPCPCNPGEQGTVVSSAKSDTGQTLSTLGAELKLEDLADYEASLWVWRYVPLLLLPPGTVGNVLTIWIFTCSPMGSRAAGQTSSAQGLYFRALAVSDLCLLYSGLLRNWLKYFFRFDLRDVHDAVCKLHIYVVYVSSMTSAWFLVAMTSQRALSVTWPHWLAPTLSLRRNAWLVLTAVVMASCLLYAHALYGYQLRYHEAYGRVFCDYRDRDYEDFARAQWPPVDLVLGSLLPFFILIVSNLMLMVKVASSVRRVKKLTNAAGSSSSNSGSSDPNRPQNPDQAVSKRRKQSTSLNLTLICMSAMFLLLTSPICVYLVMDVYFRERLDIDVNFQAAALLAWAITNNLWYANSSINFYLYCLSGARFRQQVLRIFCGARSSQQPAGSSQQVLTRPARGGPSSEASKGPLGQPNRRVEEESSF